MPKDVLQLRDDALKQLQTTQPETGMGFHIVDTRDGVLAVLADGASLPFYPSTSYYDITDLASGAPVPRSRSIEYLMTYNSFDSRASASLALQGIAISPYYSGAAGAFPLLAAWTLTANTVFNRYISSPVDNRYLSGSLLAKTYLTAHLDAIYANTGFAAVGRFALPLPLPACHVIQYELPAGTTINIGTVSPAFGQAGGGVEIQLPFAQAATVAKRSTVPEY